jgi:hypothetical protein
VPPTCRAQLVHTNQKSYKSPSDNGEQYSVKITENLSKEKSKIHGLKIVDSSSKCNWIIQGGGKYIPRRVNVK